MAVHPTAIIAPQAQIDPSAEIGPYCLIDPHVKIGPRTRLGPHCHLTGWTTIGADNRIHAGVIIGEAPQDLSYQGDRSYVVIGDRNTIREYATIHRGTPAESRTEIGDDCFIMGAAHLAHNVRLGNKVTLANAVLLAGFVEIDDGAFFSGSAMAHQFVRIGRLAMLRGAALATMDVPPFMTCVYACEISNINLVGLRRAGFTKEQIAEVKQAYRILYRSNKPFRQSIEQIRQMVRTEPGRQLVEFLTNPSRRGIAGRPRRKLSRTTAPPEDHDADMP